MLENSFKLSTPSIYNIDKKETACVIIMCTALTASAGIKSSKLFIFHRKKRTILLSLFRRNELKFVPKRAPYMMIIFKPSHLVNTMCFFLYTYSFGYCQRKCADDSTYVQNGLHLYMMRFMFNNLWKSCSLSYAVVCHWKKY